MLRATARFLGERSSPAIKRLVPLVATEPGWHFPKQPAGTSPSVPTAPHAPSILAPSSPTAVLTPTSDFSTKSAAPPGPPPASGLPPNKNPQGFPRAGHSMTTEFSLAKSMEGSIGSPDHLLMWYGGPTAFINCKKEEYADYINKFPLLWDVPKDRLIVPNQKQPYLTSEVGNSLFRSSLRIPVQMHSLNIRTKGLFYDGNVVVLTDFVTVGLKDAGAFVPNITPLTDQEKVEDLQEVIDFHMGHLIRLYGPNIFQLLPKDLAVVFTSLGNSPLDEEGLVNSPTFLPRLGRSVLKLRLYSLLAKDIFLRGDQSLNAALTRIYTMLPYQLIDDWLAIANRHPVLKKNIPLGQTVADPKGLVAIHRHGVVHAIEGNIERILSSIGAHQYSALKILPHQLDDSTDLYHYSYPLYLPDTVKACRQENLDGPLNVPGLFFVPTSLQ